MRMFVASRARSAKDQAAQLSLKFRGKGQGGSEDLEGKDLKVCVGELREGVGAGAPHHGERGGELPAPARSCQGQGGAVQAGPPGRGATPPRPTSLPRRHPQAELEAKEREHLRRTKGVNFEGARAQGRGAGRRASGRGPGAAARCSACRQAGAAAMMEGRAQQGAIDGRARRRSFIETPTPPVPRTNLGPAEERKRDLELLEAAAGPDGGGGGGGGLGDGGGGGARTLVPRAQDADDADDDGSDDSSSSSDDDDEVGGGGCLHQGVRRHEKGTASLLMAAAAAAAATTAARLVGRGPQGSQQLVLGWVAVPRSPRSRSASAPGPAPASCPWPQRPAPPPPPALSLSARPRPRPRPQPAPPFRTMRRSSWRSWSASAGSARRRWAPPRGDDACDGRARAPRAPAQRLPGRRGAPLTLGPPPSSFMAPPPPRCPSAPLRPQAERRAAEEEARREKEKEEALRTGNPLLAIAGGGGGGGPVDFGVKRR
jgi:hypothetical protein